MNGTSFRDRLIACGALLPSDVDGVPPRSARFETVVDAVDTLVSLIGTIDRPEVLRFPPAMARADLVRSGYLKSFPPPARYDPLL